MLLTHIKRTAVMITAYMLTVTAVAVPAFRQWIDRSLADGTSIKVMVVGDEHGHWFVDESGKALATNADGTLYYMTDAELASHRSARQQRSARANSERGKRAEFLRSKGKTMADAGTLNGKAAAQGKIGGKVRGLVVLVEFPDRKFSMQNPQEVFDDRFNTVGCSQGNMIGSVHDYFYDQSYGQFDISFDVVGPVTTKREMAYYGANKGDFDGHPAEIIPEVVEQLRSTVDFSLYNWDGDTYVDQVFVIYAGTGEHRTLNADEIWAHESKVSEWGITCPKANGVFINTYAMSCELANASGYIDGIGTACHEFSHCLGLPDTYDTDYSGGTGMINWDLMHSGNYNGPNGYGEIPAPYTSYERWYSGWLQPIELTSPCIVKDMPPLTEDPTAYIVYNDGNRNEYFMFENHQPTGWDSYTTCYGNGSGHGMLILHVDYDKNAWTENTVNDNPNHQRMTFISASDNYQSSYSMFPGHLYPGTTCNNTFTDDSTPSSKLYNKNANGSYYLGKPITDITEIDGKVSFCFMCAPEPPEAIEPLSIGNDSFTAAWRPSLGAVSYSLLVTPGVYSDETADQNYGKLLLSEDFSKLPTSSASEITNVLDTYTTTPGWVGIKVFNDKGYLRLSNSSSYGCLATAPVTPSTGSMTVVFDAKKYNTDGSDFLVYLTAPSTLDKYIKEDGKMYVHDATLTTDWQQIKMYFDISRSCSVFFEPAKRAYIDNLRIYDGKLSDEEINALENGTGESGSGSQSDGSILITGITGTDRKIEGLTLPDYYYRVKAITKDGETTWSNAINVHLTSTSHDAHTMDIIPSTNAAIYSLQGVYLGTDINNLPSGIYIQGNRKISK